MRSTLQALFIFKVSMKSAFSIAWRLNNEEKMNFSVKSSNWVGLWSNSRHRIDHDHRTNNAYHLNNHFFLSKINIFWLIGWKIRIYRWSIIGPLLYIHYFKFMKPFSCVRGRVPFAFNYSWRLIRQMALKCRIQIHRVWNTIWVQWNVKCCVIVIYCK